MRVARPASISARRAYCAAGQLAFDLSAAFVPLSIVAAPVVAPSVPDFLRERFGDSWAVVRRRTPAMAERYSRLILRAEYDAAMAEYVAAFGEPYGAIGQPLPKPARKARVKATAAVSPARAPTVKQSARASVRARTGKGKGKG